MTMSFQAPDGHTYRAERDFIMVPPSLGPRLDPDWTYTDAAGHTHTADRALLVYVQDDPEEPEVMFDEDGEEYPADEHLECSLCGEWINPGTKPPSPFAEAVPGATSYFRDDEPITPAEFKAAVEPFLPAPETPEETPNAR